MIPAKLLTYISMLRICHTPTAQNFLHNTTKREVLYYWHPNKCYMFFLCRTKRTKKSRPFVFSGRWVAPFAESPASRDRIEWRFRALMPHPSLFPEKSGGHGLSIPIYYSVALHGYVVVVPSDLRERVVGRCYVWELRSTVGWWLSRILCRSAGEG